MKRNSQTFVLFASLQLLPIVAFATSLLGPDDIRLISAPPLYHAKTAYIKAGEESFIIFERIHGADFQKIELAAQRIDEDSLQSPSVKLLGKEYAHWNTLAGAKREDANTWLYFASSKGHGDNAVLKKALFSASAALVDESVIDTDVQLRGAGFPFLFGSSNTFLAFREANCCKLGFAKQAAGTDSFEAEPFPSTGFMPALASFANGTLVYTYQRAFKTQYTKADGNPVFSIKSRFRLSNDEGTSWTDESQVSTKSD